MARRRRDRWLPPEAASIPRKARGAHITDVTPPLPVRAWLQTPDRQIRVDAIATAATADAVLVEWGFGQARTAAWVWRAAVKHRRTVQSD